MPGATQPHALRVSQSEAVSVRGVPGQAQTCIFFGKTRSFSEIKLETWRLAPSGGLLCSAEES